MHRRRWRRARTPRGPRGKALAASAWWATRKARASSRERKEASMLPPAPQEPLVRRDAQRVRHVPFVDQGSEVPHRNERDLALLGLVELRLSHEARSPSEVGMMHVSLERGV